MSWLKDANEGDDVYIVANDNARKKFAARIVKKARLLITVMELDTEGRLLGWEYKAAMKQDSRHPVTRADFGYGSTIYKSEQHYLDHLEEERITRLINEKTMSYGRHAGDFSLSQLKVAAEALGINVDDKS